MNFYDKRSDSAGVAGAKSVEPWQRWAWGLAALWCLAQTYVGQSFLAFNRLNDADSSYFIYGGWILRQGQVLYRDFWDQKPPGIFWQNAVLLHGFCRGNFAAYAMLHGLAVLAACWACARALVPLLGTGLALLAACAFAYGFNLNNYQDFGNRPEFALALLELAGFFCALRWVRGEGKTKTLAWTGTFSAWAFWFKPVGGVAAVAAGITILLRARTLGLRATLQALGWLVAGVQAGLLPVLLAFAFTGDALAPIRAAILVPLKLADESAPSHLQALRAMLSAYGPLWGLIWPLAWAPRLLLGDYLKDREKQILRLTVLFLLGSLAGVLIQRRGHPHYYLQGVGPLVFAAFLTVGYFLQCIRQPLVRIALLLALLMGAAITGRFPLERQLRYWSWLPRYEASLGPCEALAQNLVQRLQPAETVYYWSHGYQPYILMKRFSPGRLSPFLMAHGPLGAGLVLADLTRVMAVRPRFVIENLDSQAYPSVFLDGSALRHPDQLRCLLTYQGWIAGDYRLIPSPAPGFRVYERRIQEPAAPALAPAAR